MFKYTEVIKKEYKWNFKQLEKIIFSKYGKLTRNYEIQRLAIKSLYKFIREYRFEILGNYQGYKIIHNGYGIFKYIENENKIIPAKIVFKKIKEVYKNKYEL